MIEKKNLIISYKVNILKGGKLRNKMNGGNIEVYPNDISQEQWNKEEITMIRNLGYTGEIKYNKNGGIERIG